MQPTKKFEVTLAETVQWIRDHQERFWAITGSTFLVILLTALIVHHRQTENEEAWTQLGAVQGQLMQGKFDETRKGLENWQTRFQGSSAATYSKFMKADLLYKTTDYIQAAQVYADLAQTGRPDTVKPLALSAQIDCEEMAGHIPEAQALSQTFLDRYPDHFLSGPRYMSQARLAELAGNSAAAVAIYEKFILLFPQSPWTELARGRSQALSHK
jgi:tetratricopeptide (TPR) repeat protein